MAAFQFTLRTLLLLLVVLGSSLAVFGAGGIVVFVLVVGLAILLKSLESLMPLVFSLAAIGLICLYILLPKVGSHPAGPRSICLNNLHQLALALQNYHAVTGHFPPAYTIDEKAGQPLQSWRTLILPYLEFNALFKNVDLAQSWDSAENKKVTACQLKEFVCPSDPSSSAPESKQTNYFAVVGANAAWAGDKPRKLSDFRDESSNTIILIEVENSGVDWAEPRDFSLDAMTRANGQPPALAVSSGHGRYENFFFTSDRPGGACAAMVDSTVRYLPPAALLPENLSKLLRIGGCKQEDLDKYELSYAEVRRPNWFNIASLAM